MDHTSDRFPCIRSIRAVFARRGEGMTIVSSRPVVFQLLLIFLTFQIYIPECDTGFCAGQHICLRVFFDGGGIFEAHPFSSLSLPSSGSSFSCIRFKHVCNYLERDCEAGTDTKNRNARPIEEEGPGGSLWVRG